MAKKNDKAETIGNVLFTQDQIYKRAKELGKQISKDFAGEELIVIGTLKGSILWMADILKNLELDTEIDFMIASSYGSSTTSSGVVKIKMDAETNLYQKNVLVVEDIIDTGKTLAFIIDKIKERSPKSISICTMLDKPSRRVTSVVPEYVGFSVDDIFIVGYGLDFDQKYRNLPYVSYLEGIE